ncbi:N-formylglutamate amidohydrolase, partial [Bacteroidota bacterium]
SKTMEVYTDFYQELHEALTFLSKKHASVVVLDLHSYNHRRNGPKAVPEDEILNPEINLGTGTMNREYWSGVVDRFINDLSMFEYSDRHFDVRENIKFKGGYFGKWIHENFPEHVCCISIEFKKFFMDEWTGIPDHALIKTIGDALTSTLPGIMEELSKRK